MKVNKEQFLEILSDLKTLIENDDSFEGRLSYTAMPEYLQRGEFEVEAFMRNGNSQGQGGALIIQSQENLDAQARGMN